MPCNKALPYIKSMMKGRPTSGALISQTETLLLGACLGWRRAFTAARLCGVTSALFRSRLRRSVWLLLESGDWPVRVPPEGMIYPLLLMESWAQSKEAIEDEEWRQWLYKTVETRWWTPDPMDPLAIIQAMALYLVGLNQAEAKIKEVNALLSEGAKMPATKTMEYL